jgi:hypothetical protein
MEEIDIPSTLPSGKRLEPLKIRTGPVQEVKPGARVLEVRVRYSDLLGEFNYETRVVIEATFGASGCEARFLDSDERLNRPGFCRDSAALIHATGTAGC